MKKIGILTLVITASIAFTSCSTDKCECTVNGQTSTITEDDVNNGSTLKETCDDADAVNKAQGSGSCKMI